MKMSGLATTFFFSFLLSLTVRRDKRQLSEWRDDARQQQRQQARTAGRLEQGKVLRPCSGNVLAI